MKEELLPMPEVGCHYIFDRLLNEHIAFTTATFPKATAEGALKHMKRELKEIEECIAAGVPLETLAIECSDALGCYIDYCNRIGVTPTMLNRAFDIKLRINQTRKWKDNGDGSYSHIK